MSEELDGAWPEDGGWERELRRVVDVAAEVIGTGPELRVPACVDVLADWTRKLLAEVEALRKRVEELMDARDATSDAWNKKWLAMKERAEKAERELQEERACHDCDEARALYRRRAAGAWEELARLAGVKEWTPEEWAAEVRRRAEGLGVGKPDAFLVESEGVAALRDHAPESCPTWYDGCHCTVDALRHNIERAEKAEAKRDALASKAVEMELLWSGTNAELEEAREHEKQTHQQLGAILGTDDALHVLAQRMKERADKLQADLDAALDLLISIHERMSRPPQERLDAAWKRIEPLLAEREARRGK